MGNLTEGCTGSGDTVRRAGNGVLRLVAILFFLSGLTALAYEIIWFRRATHVWGSSTLAMAAVTASFLAGLALGARILGGIADRLSSPLAWYGWCEIGIGAAALLVPFEMRLLARVSSATYPLLESHPVAHFLARLALTFVALGPPCILMGGTLPLVLRHLTLAGRPHATGTGWLYGINTLGAALGCYLTGFHALPTLGLLKTNFVAAAVNFAIGALALATARVVHQISTPVSPPDANSGPDLKLARPRPDTPGPSPAMLGLAASLVGCGALILQMVWARQLALILGGSTYAFTSVVFIMLLGIGAGSLLFRYVAAVDSPSAPALVIVVIVVATFCGRLLEPSLTLALGLVRPVRDSQILNGLVSLGAGAALEIVAAVMMGILFPLLVHLRRASGENAARSVGDLYALNTAGAVAGIILVAGVVLPSWGTGSAMRLASVLYGGALIALFRPRSWSDVLAGLACCALLGVALFFPVDNDPRITNSGAYLYGYRDPSYLRATKKVLHFGEGAACSVLVTEEDGYRALRVNGKVDATDGGDMPTQLGLAYFPRLLRPRAREVLVIGFGSGTTTGASLLFPETRVTCTEIEPEVFAAARHFSAVNHRPEESPLFKVVFEDGRGYLQGTRSTYDMVLSEPSNPWMAGVANLFTSEFYETVKERLVPGGLLAQWIQAYSFSVADYALVARTVMSVFPHVGLIRLSGSDTILLASTSSLAGTRADIDAAQELVDSLDAVRQDLTQYYETTDVRTLLLSHYILGGAGLRSLVTAEGSEAIHTDYNLRLEFDAPLRLFEETSRKVGEAIAASAGSSWFTSAFDRWGCSVWHVRGLHGAAKILVEHDRTEPALEIIEYALKIDGDDAGLLAQHLILAPDVDRARFQETLDQILARSAAEANRVGVALWQSAKHELAVRVYEGLVRVYPESPTAWSNLAGNYRALGLLERAEKAARKALALDPLSEFAQKGLARIERDLEPKREENDAER